MKSVSFFYYDSFLDKLSENIEIKYNQELFYPTSTEACYLQFEYIVDNTYPSGEKYKLQDANDNTTYSTIHGQYHEYFTDLIERFGFYDLFLVDLEEGDILYSVYKETDFATNLYSGPYRESNLAELAKKLRKNRDQVKPTMVDYELYRPSFGAPAAFVGVAVTSGIETLGAIIFQLPVDKINNIMTGEGNWQEEGLGESGETFLVGDDYLMRSISRFFVQDSSNYSSAMIGAGMDEDDVKKMFRLGTTINFQKVKTETVQAALKGDSGVQTIEDYRGEEVISAYAPVQLNGLNYAILSEIDSAEAYGSLNKFQKWNFITLFLSILLATFLAMLLANRFIQPIDEIHRGVLRADDGDFDQPIIIDSKDELGALATSFNGMVQHIKENETEIQKQADENDRILGNFVPTEIAKELKKGSVNIADTHPNVSIIVIDLVGFSAINASSDAKKAINLLNSVIDAFDEVASKYGVTKIRTVGDTYFASCGLRTAKLDHAHKIFDFAREARQLLNQLNINFRVDLSLHIGIHSGPVTAGIVGTKKYSYDLWGPTVINAYKMMNIGDDGKIYVTQEVYEKLESEYQFRKLENEQTALITSPVWEYLDQKIS